MSHSRRIKTQIVGPAHRFAIVIPPELARTCLNEARWLGIPEPEVGGAGLEFSGRLNDAYACNLGLRTASRVLCRLEPFRAGVAEELFYKASQIPWDLWLNPEIPLDIEVRVEYSRVSHEKRVGEIIVGGIQKCFGQKGLAYASTAMADEANRDTAAFGRLQSYETGLKQKVLVSLVKNHCEISLDMSGAHLHQRGYRRRHSGAPLRETLAAAVLFKSDWKFGEPLVDGMCGSGTFPIEAALMSRRIPPGFGRDFLFQRWPSFKKRAGNILCAGQWSSRFQKLLRRLSGLI